MNSTKIKLLLWSGCLGAIILFSGDMLYYGAWGSGKESLSNEVWISLMASVPLWRHHFGAITGPVGVGLVIIGYLGLWFCCRQSAPRFALVMLAFFYLNGVFSILQHGIFGPVGFALHYAGPKSALVDELYKLNNLLGKPQFVGSIVGSIIWFFLAIIKKAGVPRWTVLFCPLITYWLYKVIIFVPAPLGMPLEGGWNNIVDALWFLVLALTYKDNIINKDRQNIIPPEIRTVS